MMGKCNTCGKMACMEHGGELEMPMMADGGEMMSPEDEGDDELHHAIAGELMDSLEKKDKKGVLEAIKAIAMSCGGKV